MLFYVYRNVAENQAKRKKNVERKHAKIFKYFLTTIHFHHVLNFSEDFSPL